MVEACDVTHLHPSDWWVKKQVSAHFAEITIDTHATLCSCYRSGYKAAESGEERLRFKSFQPPTGPREMSFDRADHLENTGKQVERHLSATKAPLERH